MYLDSGCEKSVPDQQVSLRCVSNRNCVEQVKQGISPFYLTTNLGTWLSTDEETHHGPKGKWDPQHSRMEICKILLTDDVHMADVLSQACLQF